MGAQWSRNEPTAAKRRCAMLIQKSDGSLAPRETDFSALGYVYICGVTAPDFTPALGTLTNQRVPVEVADDVVESVDTGTDTLTLTGHGYELGDGPFIADEVFGSHAAGADFWVIVVDENTIAVADSLANAYADTRIALAGTEDGATISDTADTERGIDGHFIFEATQAETDHAGPETIVIVHGGTDYDRSIGAGGYTTVAMASAADDWGGTAIEGSLTRDDLLRLCARSLVANFTKVGSDYVIRDIPDSKDSHESTVTPSGKTGSNVIDPT